MPGPTPITEITEGIVSIEGVVKRADAPLLEAPASGRQCVAYVVTSGVLTGALTQGAQPFFVKDETGEVLVVPDRFTARLGGRERHANLDVVDADAKTVSDELAGLREQLSGNRDPDMVRRRRTLRKLYTLLCAIRAHARGNCHVGKSLEGQERYIARNTELFKSEHAPQKLMTLKVTREETVLTVGQRARVTGLADRRAHALATGAGYRERSTMLVVLAPEDEPLLLVGEGAEEVEAERLQEHNAVVTPKQDPVRWQIAVFLMFLIVIVLGLLFKR